MTIFMHCLPPLDATSGLTGSSTCIGSSFCSAGLGDSADFGATAAGAAAGAGVGDGTAAAGEGAAVAVVACSAAGFTASFTERGKQHTLNTYSYYVLVLGYMTFHDMLKC